MSKVARNIGRQLLKLLLHSRNHIVSKKKKVEFDIRYRSEPNKTINLCFFFTFRFRVCMLFVFASLVEYAVLLRMRFGGGIIAGRKRGACFGSGSNKTSSYGGRIKGRKSSAISKEEDTAALNARLAALDTR